MSGAVFLGFLAGLIGAIVVGVATSLLTNEAEGWLDVLPGWLLRLARSRLPAEQRDDLFDEWAAEMVTALHNTEGRPLTRLVLGIRYAAGLLVAARKIAEELGTTRADEQDRTPVVGDGRDVRRMRPLLGRATARLVLGAVGGDPRSDADLLAAVAKDRDQAAFKMLYDRHLPWLRPWLSGRLSDESLVADVLQETFFVVWNKADCWQADGEVGAWIRRIAMAKLLDELKPGI